MMGLEKVFASMLFALKLLMAPLLIGVASLLARRYGPAAGGVFAALPLTSGPVLLSLALERGPLFAASAAEGIVLAVVPLTTFAWVYAGSAARFGWMGSSAAGALAYLASAAAVALLPLTSGAAFALACVALVVASRTLLAASSGVSTAVSSPADIPVRMLLAALLVLTITALAGRLGPRASGLLTPFPIAATILTAGTHRVAGAGAAVGVLRGLIAGLFSFALFFLVVGLAIEPYGIAVAFVAATVAAVLVQLVGYLGHAKAWPSIPSWRATLQGGRKDRRGS